jgi:competence protein ComEC
MARYILLLNILLLIFLFRVFQVGGLDPNISSDSKLEDLGEVLSPIRESVALKAQYLLPEPQASLLTGMVLGVKNNLPFDFKKALTNTSTIHVVVASGQNLTLLSGFLMGFVFLLGRKRTLTLTLAINFFYAFLTGLQIPIIRAALMNSAVLGGQLLNREVNNFWVLTLTGFLMLIYNPNWLFSISFQLSFLATFGVMVVTPLLIERTKILPNIIKTDLLVSVCAQLMVLPIIGANFYTISLIGVLVNALVLWTVPFIMISGTLALLMSFISITLAQFLALIPGIFLTYFTYIVQFLNLKEGVIILGQVSFLIWLGYYLIIAALIFYLINKNPKL